MKTEEFNGPLAQWSEHSAHNRQVSGSSPEGSTKRRREMKITEKEFEAIESALYAAAEEGMLLAGVSGAFDKMRQIYKRYRWFIDSLEGFDPSELMREYQEEFGEDGEEK